MAIRIQKQLIINLLAGSVGLLGMWDIFQKGKRWLLAFWLFLPLTIGLLFWSRREGLTDLGWTLGFLTVGLVILYYLAWFLWSLIDGIRLADEWSRKGKNPLVLPLPVMLVTAICGWPITFYIFLFQLPFGSDSIYETFSFFVLGHLMSLAILTIAFGFIIRVDKNNSIRLSIGSLIIPLIGVMGVNYFIMKNAIKGSMFFVAGLILLSFMAWAVIIDQRILSDGLRTLVKVVLYATPIAYMGFWLWSIVDSNAKRLEFGAVSESS